MEHEVTAVTIHMGARQAAVRSRPDRMWFRRWLSLRRRLRYGCRAERGASLHRSWLILKRQALRNAGVRGCASYQGGVHSRSVLSQKGVVRWSLRPSEDDILEGDVAGRSASDDALSGGPRGCGVL